MTTPQPQRVSPGEARNQLSRPRPRRPADLADLGDESASMRVPFSLQLLSWTIISVAGECEILKTIATVCEERGGNFSECSLSPGDGGRGEYEVTFATLQINNCTYDNYKVDVFLLQTVSGPSECIVGSNIEKERLREFDISPVQNCNKLKFTICMKYLFRGCYLFRITPKVQTNSYRPVEHYKWIQNEYSQNDFFIHKPTLTFRNMSRSHIEVKWEFNQTFDKSKFITQFQKSNGEIIPHSCRVNHNYTTFSTSINCCCRISTNTEIGVELALVNDTWRCEYMNSIYQDTCIWSDSKEWLMPLGGQEVHMSHHFAMRVRWLPMIVATVVASLVVALLSCYSCRAQRRDPSARCDTASFSPLPSNRTQDKIILLYAQEDSSFMNYMKTLGKQLMENNQYLVYDMHDNENIQEIARCPFEFINNTIKQKNCQFILVVSKNLDKLYQNMTSSPQQDDNAIEDSPLIAHKTWGDTMVVHTISALSLHFDCTSYNNVFVGRMQNSDEELPYLAHINQHKRYDLPQQQAALLTDLSQALAHVVISHAQLLPDLLVNSHFK